ncbi:mitochondrial carrier domain-containing protein [Jimgerdemannia flammicorona]|uniref:Mitochondrial carrier domain-containing protein n=1 Tax=Jimgerdemannia flammicorona TaxID=994334 RepID=A0A433AK84_9FUNG|nr:mitochondrial carrier domain-containing protein [Jimgerdemannia flammicorona]
MAQAIEKSLDYKLPPIGHALSGAVGSAIANCIVYPLDISVTRLQIEKKKKDEAGDGSFPEDKEPTLISNIVDIYRNEGGIRGLYAGLGSDTLATVLSNFIYFYCYSTLRHVQERRKERKGKDPRLGIMQELFLGAEAGLVARFFTTPVGNVTTRQQAGMRKVILEKGKMREEEQPKVTTLGILRDIWNEKGITGFWTGYRASAILVTNPSLTYFFFEQIKRVFLKLNKQRELTAFQTFLFSAVSKSLATAITYPFIFTKTNMVVGETDNEDEDEEVPSGRMTDIIRRTGMQAQIIKGFFNHGLMFMIKDKVAAYLTLIFYIATRRLSKDSK